MFQKNCELWLTLLTCCFCIHSVVDGSNERKQNTACDVFGTCSQVCTTHAEKVSCSCAEGFKLKKNGWGCDPLDASWKLIYNAYYEWWVVSMWQGQPKNRTKVTIPIYPRGITYDARNNEIYTVGFKYPSNYSVFRTSLQDWSSVELFGGFPISENLAFDWTTGNIYFADSHHSQISVCQSSSNVCAVLIDKTIIQSNHIALHPESGLLFWTEYGALSGIMRAGMDGSKPHKIIFFNSQWPIGMTVDQSNERIYFVEYYHYAIKSSRFDGSDQKIAVSGEIAGKPSRLVVFGDRIIWYDSSFGQIQSAEKFNGSNRQVVLSNVGIMNGLVVFHVSNQPVTGSSPCVGANCSHICTIAPQKNFKCFCPAGMQLAQDRKSCIDLTNCDDATDEVNCTGVMREAAGKDIPTSAFNNNNVTAFVVVIVVLLALIVVTRL